MTIRPQGMVTRTIVEALSPRRWTSKRLAAGAAHGG
jgi:hypothetical protein